MRKVLLLIESSRGSGRGLLRGIAKYSRFHGEWTFLRKSPFYLEPHLKLRTLPQIGESDVDGVIMLQEPQNEEILSLGIPTVAVLLTHEEPHSIPRIIGNHKEIIRMAAEHLQYCGFRRLAYCGFDDLHWSNVRAGEFEKIVNQLGIVANFYEQPKSKAGKTWELECPIMMEWLKSLTKPIGLLACNDDRAQDVLMACSRAGIHVPDEVAVLGIDNDKLACELCKPPLSSVALNYERAGYEGAALLDSLMKGKKTNPKRIYIEPMYVHTRVSTDILAVEDKQVSAAIRFIREHAHEPIQVDNVVEVVTVSRRVLYERFHRILGRGVNEEITHVRINKVAEMLLGTNLTVQQIAQSLGFTSPDHIARYFRKAKGISPLDFRRKYANI